MKYHLHMMSTEARFEKEANSSREIAYSIPAMSVI